MNPAPLIWLVVLLARLGSSGRKKPVKGSWVEPEESALRANELGQQGVAVALLALVGLIGTWLSMGVGLVVVVPVLALAIAPGATRSALLARGWVRPATWAMPLDFRWRRDPSGAVAAVLAIGLLRSPDDAAIAERLDRELLALRRVTAGSVLAAGIRCLARGEHAEARRLLRLVAEFDASKRPPTAHQLAGDLLVGVAAAEGDLDRVLAELDRPRAPQTPLGALLRRCVERARGAPVSESELRRAWFLAGARADTWTLVDRVMGIAPEPPSSPPQGETPLDTALLATARLMGEAPPPLDAIVDAADRWDRALRDPTAVPGGEPGAQRLRTQVVDVLAERLATCRQPVTRPPESAVLREVLWQCGAARDAELLWLSDELGSRTDARRALPLLDEVRAWLALVDAYQRVIEVAPQRASSSFAKLYYPSVRHTVWLHNERDQATLANAMYRVELRYADLVSHDSGIPLLQKNLRCGP